MSTLPLRHLGLLAASALIATGYIGGVHMLPQSHVSAEAALSIDAPFVYRLLLPWILGWVFPAPVLDGFWLRWITAALSVHAVLCLMPLYAERVAGSHPDNRLPSGLLYLATSVVLISHYVLPHRFHFYYIYDLPAIAMYLAVFLVLVSTHRWKWPMAAVMVGVFSVNRETVAVAVFHALAVQWEGAPTRVRANVALLLKSAALVVVVVGVRMLLVHAIQAPKGQVMEFMDGDDIRLVANVKRILTQYQHTVTLAYFGGGALVWLYFCWNRFGGALKRVFQVSVLPFGLLMVVGNPTELRIFNEFVPMLSLGLSISLLNHFRKNSAGVMKMMH